MENNSAVIKLDNVGILFRRGKGRGAVRDLVNSLLRRHQGMRGRVDGPFWGLKGVSLDVRRGETVGIVGDNGSGKTTLLKLISRIYQPTEGRIETRGRITALLELGTGFHEELTGRDNVFLYGTILGLKNKEIKNIYESIVEFSEIGPFMDTPLKRYSSGMKVRLGFSVAVHLKPDILLLDEVLGVGDWRFRLKSFRAMQEKKREGVTILLVSHNLSEIQ
ncbi:MAG: ABC transporter ATP-binding protein, partial [Deltaproteobacteria bacterium]